MRLALVLMIGVTDLMAVKGTVDLVEEPVEDTKLPLHLFLLRTPRIYS